MASPTKKKTKKNKISLLSTQLEERGGFCFESDVAENSPPEVHFFYNPDIVLWQCPDLTSKQADCSTSVLT